MAPVKAKPRKLALTPRQIRDMAAPKNEEKKVTNKVPVDLTTYFKKAMSKELQLTIGERIAAAKIFDAFKGAITQLAAILDDVKSIVITEDEWNKAKLVKTPVEGSTTGAENWNWTDEGSEKTVTFSQEAVDYLRKEIKTKSEANELTLADKALITLEKKLTA